MTTTPQGEPNVRRIELHEYIKEAEQSIDRFEQAYECSTADMIEAVHTGKVVETPEISSWLFLFRTKRWTLFLSRALERESNEEDSTDSDQRERPPAY